MLEEQDEDNILMDFRSLNLFLLSLSKQNMIDLRFRYLKMINNPLNVYLYINAMCNRYWDILLQIEIGVIIIVFLFNVSILKIDIIYQEDYWRLKHE